MKTKIAFILMAAMTVVFAACGTKTGNTGSGDGNGSGTESEISVSENIEGSCADVLAGIYKETGFDKDFIKLENVEITEENEEYILGTTEIDYSDYVCSAPMMSSIAYQCILLRAEANQDIDEAKKLLEDHANPRKWICVEAESVVVENVGDMILFVMADDEYAMAIKNAFLALGK